MPISVEEYQVAQLYTVAEASKENTSSDHGVQYICNEPFTNEEYGSGQYTFKVYHMGSMIPSALKTILPKTSYIGHEKAWNCYPKCTTVYTNPFFKKSFSMVISSQHLDDLGESENVFDLTPQQLKARKVVYLDIVNDYCPDNSPDKEPSTFRSKKTNRSFEGYEDVVLDANSSKISNSSNVNVKNRAKWWEQEVKPEKTMCCYKLATIQFNVFGLKSITENFFKQFARDSILKFHKNIFCDIDEWYGLDMNDIRILEENVKKELECRLRENGLETVDGEDSSSGDGDLCVDGVTDSDITNNSSSKEEKEDEFPF